MLPGYVDVERAHVAELTGFAGEPTGSVSAVVAIAILSARIEHAQWAKRLLLAYMREVHPSRLGLKKLAAAAGMSISGVRSAYRLIDVEVAVKVTDGLGGTE